MPTNHSPKSPLRLRAFVGIVASAGIVASTGIAASTASAAVPSVASATPAAPKPATVGVTTAALHRGACTGRFVRHDLPHVTTARDARVLPYDTNGSGLAVGDLDRDGDPDVVLGALKGTTSILLNNGHFSFSRHDLVDADSGIADSETRAVAIADVDHDGRNDIVTTHTRGSISAWHRRADGTYAQNAVDEVLTPAYALFYDDLDGDGGLDLVTSSYDALLEAELKDSFLHSSGGGITVYRDRGAALVARRLTRAAQTLAMTMFDVNGDGHRDLVVGNDFGVPDDVFVRRGSSWLAAHPFKRTTRNTMGYAVGDYDNNGRLDLFATDMKPNLGAVDEVASWMPLMQRSFERLQRSDVQRAENVLQRQTAKGRFVNVAYRQKIDATGWTWSAQFGDLDLDGTEDLYLVNGMIDHDLLPFLPRDEMTEHNAAFRVDHGRFVPMPAWGLDSVRSGRSMALADLDGDGRLDVVVNNLSSASVVYENQLCGKGESLELVLQWPGKHNVHAFGSVVTVTTGKRTMTRVVQPEGGYLTWLDDLVHVGVGAGESVTSVSVRWPDGVVTAVPGAKIGARMNVTRTS